MNIQEILDFTFEKLWIQNESALGDDRTCQYRGVNGTKCAIGHLIPDELYDEEMYGSVLNLRDHYPNLPFFNVEFNFLCDIQRCHDTISDGIGDCSFRSQLKYSYLYCAAKYNLNTDFINSFNEESNVKAI